MSIASYNRSLNNVKPNNSTPYDNNPSTPPRKCVGSLKCSPPAVVNHSPPPDDHGLEKDGNFGKVVDPFLEANYNSQQIARMAVCAASSTHYSAEKRPKMSQIVKALESDMSLEDLKKEMMESSGNRYDTMQQTIEMTKHRKTTMSSQEYGDTSELSSKEMSRYYTFEETRLDI